MRDVREVLYLIDYARFNNHMNKFIFISKALMVLGLTLSLFQRIKVKIETATQPFRSYMDESSSSILI
jgi:hypothetical protein